MSNEQQFEDLEQAKKLAEDKMKEIEHTLLKMKEEASVKVKEIDAALAKARQQNDSVDQNQASQTVQEVVFPKPEPIQELIVPKEVPLVEQPKTVAPKKAVEDLEAKKDKKDEEKERIEKLLKSRENEKQQIAELKKTLSNRTKGDKPAEPGNTGIKHTNAEVFIYIIDDNALQLKVLLEKFKTTKSFKTTKGFTSGEDCLQYIKKHKYPKNSMIMAVVDYYLDDKGNGEESNTGIDVLHMLKDFDSDIEIIVLSGSDDVDIAASATHFGAISFVKKGEDDFKKIVNNIVWAIHEKAKIRKKAETQGMIKNLSIGIAAFTILAFGIYFIYLYLDSKK